MKKSKIFGTLALVFACLGIAMLMVTPKYLKYKSGKVKNLNDENLVLEKGDLVEGTVEYCWGWAVEEYETKFGIRTSSDSSRRFYAIELDKGTLVLYSTASSSDFSTLDRITEETGDFYESAYDYADSGDLDDLVLPTTTLQIQGTVSSMESDVRDLFKEWYDDDQYFDSDTETLVITHSAFDRLFLSVIIGAAGVVLAILFLIIMLVSRKKEKYNEQFGY